MSSFDDYLKDIGAKRVGFWPDSVWYDDGSGNGETSRYVAVPYKYGQHLKEGMGNDGQYSPHQVGSRFDGYIDRHNQFVGYGNNPVELGNYAGVQPAYQAYLAQQQQRLQAQQDAVTLGQQQEAQRVAARQQNLPQVSSMPQVSFIPQGPGLSQQAPQQQAPQQQAPQPQNLPQYTIPQGPGLLQQAPQQGYQEQAPQSLHRGGAGGGLLGGGLHRGGGQQ